MAKKVYVRAFSSTDAEKCLDAAEKILERVPEITAKSFYFPTQPNENGYYSVLVRLPDNMSELKLRAKLSWALQ